MEETIGETPSGTGRTTDTCLTLRRKTAETAQGPSYRSDPDLQGAMDRASTEGAEAWRAGRRGDGGAHRHRQRYARIGLTGATRIAAIDALRLDWSAFYSL